MDYREKAFKKKFKSASSYLGVVPSRIVSLKFREIVSSYSEYHDLLDILQREANISNQKIVGDFQGTGYLLSDSKSKVILVEHETGLEILYIAGSVASLMGLIPLISQCWASMRGHFNSRRHRNMRDIEIRELDSAGKIREDRLHDHDHFGAPLLFNNLIISATQKMENEIKALREEMKILSKRVKSAGKSSKRGKRKK